MNSKMAFIKSYLKNYKYLWKFKIIICAPIIAFLLFLDWLSKGLINSSMIQGEKKDFIKGFIGFEYKINPGAAYGMNSGSPTLAISIAAVVSIFLLIIFLFLKDKYWLIGLSFMIGGSYGNLLARIWAPFDEYSKVYGGVIDFLKWDFSFLGSNEYIFNLADLFVNIAIGLIILALIIYLVDELIRVYYKKNDVLYEKYVEFRSTISKLYIIYWHKFYKKDSEFKMTFKEYYIKRKQLIREFKEDKRKILNGSEN
ncbi:lipoprotein signal peptidase [Spiroplasma litorale]|uniref:Lipoprotein signal peptidase n=1 Tax=Spiroplasma litorale TaxID=216942 RepID=A0A0K1W171_9MOLU|nr:signal peptidase II [Spiroplasma litorale]AKX33918.1 lipoprotein signal peptidase [Spiroplasma litorale]